MDENVYIIILSLCDKFIYLRRDEWIETANYRENNFFRRINRPRSFPYFPVCETSEEHESPLRGCQAVGKHHLTVRFLPPPPRVSFLDDAIMQFVTEESIGIEWSGEVIVAPPSTAHRRAETRIPANGGPLSVINRPVFAARRGEE